MILLLSEDTPAGAYNAPDMILGRTWPSIVDDVNGSKTMDASRVPASCIHTLIAWFGAQPIDEGWTSEGLNEIGGHAPVTAEGVSIKKRRTRQATE